MMHSRQGIVWAVGAILQVGIGCRDCDPVFVEAEVGQAISLATHGSCDRQAPTTTGEGFSRCQWTGAEVVVLILQGDNGQLRRLEVDYLARSPANPRLFDSLASGLIHKFGRPTARCTVGEGEELWWQKQGYLIQLQGPKAGPVTYVIRSGGSLPACRVGTDS